MSVSTFDAQALRATSAALHHYKAEGVPGRVANLLIYTLNIYSLDDLRGRSWEGENGLERELRLTPGCGPKIAAAIRALHSGA